MTLLGSGKTDAWFYSQDCHFGPRLPTKNSTISNLLQYWLHPVSCALFITIQRYPPHGDPQASESVYEILSKFPLTSVVCQAPRAEIARQFIIRLRWPLTKRSQLGGQGESRKDIRFEAEKEDTHHGDFFNSLREISLGVQFVLWMAPPPPPAHSLRECAFLQVEDTYTLHAFKVKECVFRSPS